MTGTGFKDHFSQTAAAYARFRPRYPAPLFDWLAALVPGRELAWDAGTGNGQAARALVERFARVVATDASAEQIAYATPHARIEYRVRRAESSGLPDRSCDLVTAAQALHWFDPPAFFAEARRALRPAGVVAVWSYATPALADPALDALLEDFAARVRDDWPPERALVESGYRTLAFPFEEIAAPPLVLEARLARRELCGLLATWSATWQYRRRTGRDPVRDFARRLARLAPAGARHALRWPLGIRVGRRRP